MLVLRTPIAHHGEGMEDSRRVYGFGWRDGTVRVELLRVPSAAEAGGRQRQGAGRDRAVLERVVGVKCEAAGEWPIGDALADTSRRHVRADGRSGRGTDHLAAEQIGGRAIGITLCWLRDATLTLLALMNAGNYEEAQHWRDWLLAPSPGAPSRCRSCTASRAAAVTEWIGDWLPATRTRALCAAATPRTGSGA